MVVRRCADARSSRALCPCPECPGYRDRRLSRTPLVSTLLIAAEDASQAEKELTAYDLENQANRPRGNAQSCAGQYRNPAGLLDGPVVLLRCRPSRCPVRPSGWRSAQLRAGLIRAGQWWRTVTALFLHVSGTHLLNNLAFGTVFLLLLSQVLGPGMTALAVVAAGAVGNALNALVRPSIPHVHRSVHRSICGCRPARGAEAELAAWAVCPQVCATGCHSQVA